MSRTDCSRDIEDGSDDGVADAERRRRVFARSVLARRLRKRAPVTEWRLWRFLRSKRLFGAKFRHKSALCGHVVDFYCPGAKLVIDVVSPLDRRPFSIRDDKLAKHGVFVHYVENEQVWGDLFGAMKGIAIELLRRHRRPLISRDPAFADRLARHQARLTLVPASVRDTSTQLEDHQ